MKLFTLTGASGITHPVHGQFDVDDDGGVELPDEVSDHLYAVHVNGKPAWETEAERDARLAREDLDRRRDPAYMADLMERVLADRETSTEPARRGPGRPRKTD